MKNEKGKINIAVKGELLDNFIKELLDNGFRVYVNDKKESVSWVHIEKDGNIGYIQNHSFGGLDFSTVHEPNKNCGTGFGLNEEGVCEPTIKDALNTFIFKPHWSHAKNEDIKKYSSFEEYQREGVLKYKEVLLNG